MSNLIKEICINALLKDINKSDRNKQKITRRITITLACCQGPNVADMMGHLFLYVFFIHKINLNIPCCFL